MTVEEITRKIYSTKSAIENHFMGSLDFTMLTIIIADMIRNE